MYFESEIIVTKKFINGFIHVLLDNYTKYINTNETPEFNQTIKNNWTEYNKQNTKIIDVIKDNLFCRKIAFSLP